VSTSYFAFVFYVLISYLIACFFGEKLKLVSPQKASFLKPDRRKIILFIVLFLLFPFPVGMYIEPFGFRWMPTPLSAPLMFTWSILNIIFGLEFYSLMDYIVFFSSLLSPFIIYFLSCLIIFIWDKSKRKKTI